MKGTNTIVTICGCVAAVAGALSQVDAIGKYKTLCVIVAAAAGAALAYFAKGKDVTGGTVQQ